MQSTQLFLLVFTLPGSSPCPTPSSPASAVKAAAADAARLPLKEARYFRYLWMGGVPPPERARFRAAFRLHQNLLSRETEIADVVDLGCDVWRIDLRDTKWGAATWEKAAALDPYFHLKLTAEKDTTLLFYSPSVEVRGKVIRLPGVRTRTLKAGQTFDAAAWWLTAADLAELRKRFPKATHAELVKLLPTVGISYLRKRLITEVPILSARWLLGKSARQIDLNNRQTGLGYYDFLGVKNRDDYWRLIDYDGKRSKRDLAAALERSGVSPLNRQVIRGGARDRGVWRTLDTTDQRRRGNAVRNLEGFRHQAEEWYGFLPNDLPATFLGNDKGVRQDFAPADAFGFTDDSTLREGRDGRIHVNLACMRCHAGQVLKPIDDFIRGTYKGINGLKIANVKKQKQLKLVRLYFRDLQKALVRDRTDYADAFALATRTPDFKDGLTPALAAEAYAEAYHSYADRPLTLAQAARELGVPAWRWRAALVKYTGPDGGGDLVFATWLDAEPGKVSRVSWEDGYQLAQEILAGVAALPTKVKVK